MCLTEKVLAEIDPAGRVGRVGRINFGTKFFGQKKLDLFFAILLYSHICI